MRQQYDLRVRRGDKIFTVRARNKAAAKNRVKWGVGEGKVVKAIQVRAPIREIERNGVRLS